MFDLLGIAVEDNLLETLINVLSVIVALDVFSLVAYLISSSKGVK